MSTSESRVTNLYIKAFAALLALLMVFAMVAGVFRLVKGEDKSSDVSWLYSQTANSSELDDLGGSRYHLTLRDVDFHTIQFSDRPDRLVEVIETAQLVKDWDRLFADAAPNAVLVEHDPDGSTDSLVVELQKPHFNYAADELTYEVRVLSDEEHPERLKKLANAYKNPPSVTRAVSLFIDDVTSAAPSTTPIFTGPVANALKSRLGLPSIPTAPVNLGSGVQIVSANATLDANGKVTADAVIGFQTGSFQMNMHLEVTDPKNWALTTTTVASTPWTPPSVPGLTINPSSFTGSISNSNGTIAFNLTGATHTWQVASGATYVSTPSFSSSCPISGKCPSSVNGPFISMNGTLSISGVPNISMTGAMSTNAEWARFDGTTSNLTFGGTGITSPTLTMWRGARTDSYDPNMELPSLAKLAGGNNLEFCGGFTISVPKIVNKSTSGCIRWSPSGVVIGQVGVAANLSGSVPSTGSLSAAASAQVKGLAWTNIADSALASLPSRDAIMSNVANAIQNQKIVLAGQASLPGVVANALNLDLGAASSLVVDVRGEVSATGFTLSGDINTNINLGKEPFKLAIRKMTATIAVGDGAGASFSIGTSGSATVGYSPSTRTLQTAVNMVAATSPQTGMALSVNVKGTPSAADAGKDGLTTSTRLSDPANAQYVWPDQFGIKGLNLWNLTVQVAFQNGSPALGYTSTSYMDPNGAQTGKVLKCAGTCDGADWMVGTLGFNVSYTDPCFAYSFNSASGTSGFALDGGAMKATAFAVGIAPTGCSIQSGSTTQSLPVGFAGFQFAGSFGDTTVNVATQLTTKGFVFKTTINNLKIAGMDYSTLKLDVVINDNGSNIDFDADMSSSMGSMAVSSTFETNSSGLSQSLDATLSDWSWGKSGTIDLKSFHFATSANIPAAGSGGCASFTTDADGSLTAGSRDFTLEGANFAFDCNGINNLYFKIDYDHTPKWGGGVMTSTLEFKYPSAKSGGNWTSGTKYFYGDAAFSYNRHFSKKYEDRHFSRHIDVNFSMSISVDPSNPGDSAFAFDGSFDADRVSGDIDGSFDSDGGDFTCSGRLRLDPSWAGVYHFTWDDL